MHKACSHHLDLLCRCACHLLTTENRENLGDHFIHSLVTGNPDDREPLSPEDAARVEQLVDRMRRGVYGTDED